MSHDGPYYDLPPDCKGVQDIIVKKNMCYTRGNIFKAAYRWDEKGVSDDSVENIRYNLEKIKWFAEDALGRIDEKRNDRRSKGNNTGSSNRN